MVGVDFDNAAMIDAADQVSLLVDDLVGRAQQSVAAGQIERDGGEMMKMSD